ncbi:integral membrane protein 2B isoform X2 [Microcaecilia unicolor]|uniref:Integral membrane protein 2B n=1 Tax=Microcaecilia unicolor TaxID=1415580 RepID=A0A6P7Y0N3_9AMPH|nr:integral membrane protein 2B isoform X2 [Microcaecilia unicolor]
MVKLNFNAALVQKDAPKEEEKCEVRLIVPENEDQGDVVPARQRRAWCWCMCFSLVFMLASVIFGGAYLYKYFVFQRGVYFCGVDNIQNDKTLTQPANESSASLYHSDKEGIEIAKKGDVEFLSGPIPEFSDGDPSRVVHEFDKDDTTLTELPSDPLAILHRSFKEDIEILVEEVAELLDRRNPAFIDSGSTETAHDFNENEMIPTELPKDSSRSHHQSIQEGIEILEEENVEFINVPIPEFGDSDPSRIVHDFSKNVTAYLDLRLDTCYVIPLNTSVVMPPRNFMELLKNIRAGKYMPRSYLIREQMIITEQIENVDHLGVFVSQMCRGKKTYKLKRKENAQGIQKRNVGNCHKILHFEGRLAVETLICEQ